MEDRITAGLCLEMVDDTGQPGATDRYVEGRLDEILSLTGVARATWWANVNRDRTDLPRRLPEFSTLIVYELDGAFSMRSVPSPHETSGIVGSYQFVHEPRPGQGSLSGKPTIGLSLVLISPRNEGGAQALRDWADFIHIRHIAESGVPGYGMITPYRNIGGTDPLFLHFYEMHCDDPEDAFRSMAPLVQRRLGGGPGTPAFDEWARHPELRIMYVNSFKRIGERVHA